MDPWVLPIITATFIYGGMNFLYKVSAERNLNADYVVNAVGASVAVLAFLTLLVTNGGQTYLVFTPTVLRFALFNGLFFGFGALAKFTALKFAPAGIVFPLNRLNTMMVMLIGFFFFHDKPSPIQFVGIALAIGVIVMISIEKQAGGKATYSKIRRGMVFSVLSALCTASSMTVGKLFADTPEENRIAYICCSYSLVFLITLVLSQIKKKAAGPKPAGPWRVILLFGFIIGAMNYAGYFLVLKAFGTGPISLIQATFSMSMIIPILLAYFIYRERLTWNRILAIILAILSVALISHK